MLVAVWSGPAAVPLMPVAKQSARAAADTKPSAKSFSSAAVWALRAGECPTAEPGRTRAETDPSATASDCSTTASECGVFHTAAHRHRVGAKRRRPIARSRPPVHRPRHPPGPSSSPDHSSDETSRRRAIADGCSRPPIARRLQAFGSRLQTFRSRLQTFIAKLQAVGSKPQTVGSTLQACGAWLRAFRRSRHPGRMSPLANDL